MKKISKIVLLALLIGTAGVGYAHWNQQRDGKTMAGVSCGNGRIEATEVNIATPMSGKVDRILVSEGDYVTEGQLLAVMQTDTLEAELTEARAQLQKAITDEKSAQVQVAARENEKKVSQALVKERAANVEAAQRRYKRTKALVAREAISVETSDNDETTLSAAKAALESAKAQVEVRQSAIDAAKADLESRRADIKTSEAKIARIETSLDDCYLKAPRNGRVQYRVAQSGEVLGAGGKLLNLVDLTDVYMTFYLPETEVGRVPLNSDARIVLDTATNYAIPAKISFVANVAQFTPKTVETQAERQKLMFRIKAQVPEEFLQTHLELVKTGLPGVTWVRLDPNVEWPESLALREPR